MLHLQLKEARGRIKELEGMFETAARTVRALENELAKRAELTGEERAVLEACAAAEITPSKVLKGRSEWAIIKAELARRAARKETKP